MIGITNSSYPPFHKFCYGVTESPYYFYTSDVKEVQVYYIESQSAFFLNASELVFGLYSPFDVVCHFGSCPTSDESGYNFNIYESCLPDDYELSYSSDSSMTGKTLTIPLTRDSIKQFFIVLVPRIFGNSTYRLSKGTLYTYKDTDVDLNLCTAPFLVTDLDNYMCPADSTFFFLSFFIGICLFFGLALCIWKRKSSERIEISRQNLETQTEFPYLRLEE